METVVSALLKKFEDGRITRRQLITSLAAAALAASRQDAAAQTGSTFRTLNFDHLAYQTPDYRRSRDFYVNLLGMAVVEDNGKNACQLHFGDARGVGARERAFISLTTPDGGTAAPAARVDHIALKIDNWDTDRVRTELERRGLRPRLAQGGARDTPNYVSFHVADPDGIALQISGVARPGDSLYKRS